MKHPQQEPINLGNKPPVMTGRFALREGHLIVDMTPDHYPGVTERPRPPEPVAAVWHPDNAVTMMRMLNDLDAAREHAADDIRRAADQRVEDMRNELRRHQNAATRQAERVLGESMPNLDQSVPLGVRLAIDAVARDFIAKAVNDGLAADRLGHEEWPEISEADYHAVRDRAVAIVLTGVSTLGYDVNDAVKFLATRVTSPDEAPAPPAGPFPAPIGGDR